MAAGIGGDGRRQNSSDLGDRAVERQFAENGEALDRIGGNGADRGHDANADGQIVMAAFLRQIGGREIDGDALRRQSQARGVERRAHPLARFGDGFVAEANEREHHIAVSDLHLDIDRPRFDPLEGHRCDSHHHGPPLARTPHVPASPRS